MSTWDWLWNDAQSAADDTPKDHASEAKGIPSLSIWGDSARED